MILCKIGFCVNHGNFSFVWILRDFPFDLGLRSSDIHQSWLIKLVYVRKISRKWFCKQKISFEITSKNGIILKWSARQRHSFHWKIILNFQWRNPWINAEKTFIIYINLAHFKHEMHSKILHNFDSWWMTNFYKNFFHLNYAVRLLYAIEFMRRLPLCTLISLCVCVWITRIAKYEIA